jgi:thiol-disulfide isomerase/thioredoxin
MWKLNKWVLSTWLLILLPHLPLQAQTPLILHTLQEKHIPFESLHGKWLLIPYWASWCDACLKEIHILNDFYQQHPDKIHILAVNMDQVSAREQKQLAQQYQLAFPSLTQGKNPPFDGRELSAVPALMIFAPDGSFHSLRYGMQTPETLETFLSD